jgi:hypothetical protein
MVDVDIHDNRGSSGRLGFVNFHPIAATEFRDVAIRNHHLDFGHFRVDVNSGGAQRQGFTFTGNRSTAAAPYDLRAPLIQVGGTNKGFDGVTIRHNRDVGAGRGPAVYVSPSSTRVVTEPNDFPGFR